MKEKKHYSIHKVEDMNIYGEHNGDFYYSKYGHPEITIFVAPSGSKIHDEHGETDQTSTFGHIFIGIRGWNPVTEEREAITVGFSPGDSMKTSEDNFSFNDHLRYPDASTLSIRSYNWPFAKNFEKLFTLLHTYKTGEKLPPKYNLLFNNCGQFVQHVLDISGFKNIYIAFQPDDLYDNLKHAADNYRTPLAIDLNANGIQTLSSNSNIAFDFDSNKTPIQTGWLHPDDGFLVWDKNNDGVIDNGEELFGDRSLLPNNTKAQDGFLALSYLDSNRNKLIDKGDNLWSELKVWQDKNSDGITQKDELYSLDKAGINYIELNITKSHFYDLNNNFHQLESFVNWDNGNRTLITDVLLHQKPNIDNNKIPQQLMNNIINEMASFSSLGNSESIPINQFINSIESTVSLIPNLLR